MHTLRLQNITNHFIYGALPSLDTTIKATKVSISELADNYKSFHGQYIETTGTYYGGFEDFALYTNKNWITREAKAFWLNLHYDLHIDHASYTKMSGRRITVKGLMDTTSQGHLNSYLATITHIYYWKAE